MKPTNFLNLRLILAVLVTGLAFCLVSWDHHQAPEKIEQAIKDTVPEKKKDREKRIRDLDEALEELKNADLKIDMEKLKNELTDALKNINVEKIRLEVEKALKDVDFDKIKKEIESSLNKVDFEKIKKEFSMSMKDVDTHKILKEINESLAGINWDNIKADMEKVKDFDMKKLEEDMLKLKEEMKDLGPKLEKELAEAKKSMDKTRSEIRELKSLIDGLENDGLINKKDGYSLKHKNGELFINGKKATEKIYNKYRSFLDKNRQFNIKKDTKDFNIDIE
jgi:hypothetical protein